VKAFTMKKGLPSLRKILRGIPLLRRFLLQIKPKKSLGLRFFIPLAEGFFCSFT